MKVKKILVGTDFSDASLRALAYAGELANKLDADVHVVHIWEYPHYLGAELTIPTSGGEAQSLWQLAQGDAATALGDFVARAEQQNLRVDERKLAAGAPAPAIAEFADKEGYDLVVVGTHGRTGAAHLLLGSVAERVVRLSSVPVITVPGKEKKK